MKFNLLKNFLFTAFLLNPLTSFALIGFEDGNFPELATSGRALALGNAFIAKADDSSAVFYNPAGLGTVRHPHIHLSNIHIEANKNFVDLGTGGSLSDGMGNFSKSFKIEGMRQLIQDHPGTLSHSRYHFLPNFTARYFSMGYLISQQIRGALGATPGDLFEYAYRRDHGPYGALNLSMWGGIFKIGLSGILLNRKEAIGEQDKDEVVTIGKNSYDKGTAFILTAGTKLTLPWKGLPTFAAKLNNAGSQKFSGRAAGPPAKIKQSLDLGFSITPQIGKIQRFHFEINYKDLTQKHDDLSNTRRWAAGLEWDIARIFFVRFGYGDGFGSFGLGVKSRKLEFDLTSYAVDNTSSKFRGEEDRRFSLTISSGF